MEKLLFICNTPYQIFVATWLKISRFPEEQVDIIVSDHMNNFERIADNAKQSRIFRKVYAVKSFQLCRSAMRRREQLICVFHSNFILKKYFLAEQKYDSIYAANFDTFTRLVYHTYCNDVFFKYYQPKMKFGIIEDGIATYSSLCERFYLCTKPKEQRKLKFYHPKRIYGNLKEVFAFQPDCFLWNPDAPIIEIDKIDAKHELFKQTVNMIFDYDMMQDSYDKKYIFIEESFYAEKYAINDVELVEKIAQIVGKENIMVKIHPRNPVNRFKELGYQTNENTSIPWEVIVLNESMENKVLLTVASSAVVNPIRLFGYHIKGISLYSCLNKIPEVLESGLWEITRNYFEKYYPIIEMCDKDFKKIIDTL